MSASMFSIQSSAGIDDKIIKVLKVSDIDLRVDGKIDQSIQMSWNKITKHRHSADCYPLGKGNSYDDLGAESLEHAAVFSGVQNSSAIDIASKKQKLKVGTITLNASQEENNGTVVARVAIVNGLAQSSYRNKGDSNCVIREHHWKVQSQKVKGQAQVSFTMPKDTWLVEMSVAGLSGHGLKVGDVTGGLHEKVRAASTSQETIRVWAKPGSRVRLPIEVSGDISSQNILSLELHVSSARHSESPADMLEKLRLTMSEISGPAAYQAWSKAFLAVGASILFDRNSANVVLSENNLNDYSSLADWLFRLANVSDARFGEMESHVKAMAAVTSYRLSLAFLDQMQPFCKQVEVRLPMTGKQLQVSGLVAANYWLNRDIKRIENMRFPEIRAYLHEYIRWENNGLTYAEVAANTAEFNKIKAGYIKIREYSEFAFDIFGDARLRLKKSLQVFGTVGTSELITKEIEQELVALSEFHTSLNRDFQKEVMGTNLQNQSRIRTSLLLARLDELERRSKYLVKKLETSVKFVSPSESSAVGQSASIVGMMTGMLSHQIALFDEKLSSPFAEAVRLGFVDDARIKEAKSSYRNCLGTKK
ncbi:MAG: hypothetical protein RBT63_00960 [Bdellovibrionales bacterium]|nr:hypothetical protein [Bdellovibrionales bacterium]